MVAIGNKIIFAQKNKTIHNIFTDYSKCEKINMGNIVNKSQFFSPFRTINLEVRSSFI